MYENKFLTSQVSNFFKFFSQLIFQSQYTEFNEVQYFHILTVASDSMAVFNKILYLGCASV